MIATISSGNLTAVLGIGDVLSVNQGDSGLTGSINTGNTLTAEFYSGIEGGNMQYRYFTDGTTSFRQGVRNGVFVTDKALTDTGFSGTEDTDWKEARQTNIS